MKIARKTFIELLGAKLSITKTNAERNLLAILKLIMDSTCAGHEVVFSGFGKFSVHDRKGRIGVNPRDPSKKLTISASKTPKFKAGEYYKSLANRI